MTKQQLTQAITWGKISPIISPILVALILIVFQKVNESATRTELRLAVEEVIRANCTYTDNVVNGLRYNVNSNTKDIKSCLFRIDELEDTHMVNMKNIDEEMQDMHIQLAILFQSEPRDNTNRNYVCPIIYDYQHKKK